jgi:hypothetical protein
MTTVTDCPKGGDRHQVGQKWPRVSSEAGLSTFGGPIQIVKEAETLAGSHVGSPALAILPPGFTLLCHQFPEPYLGRGDTP